LIRRDIAKSLSLEGPESSLNIENACLNSINIKSQLVNFKIESNQSKGISYEIESAWVVPNLTVSYHKINIKETQSKYKHLQNVNLPKLNPGDVTVLIGTDHSHLLVHHDFKIGEDHEPCAVETKLGWVLMGGRTSKSTSIKANLIETSSFNIENFWNIENYGTERNDRSTMTPYEQRAYNILESTTQFNNGHYETGMLWKTDDVILPYNKTLAIQRLESLEKRFSRKPDLAVKYSEALNKYISQGHAIKLSKEK